MAHFAKLGADNIVTAVRVVHNDVATNEQAGVDILNSTYKTNDVLKQTSYNTAGGVHRLGGTPFRKNFAGLGHTYDETRDAFIAPKAFSSLVLNETTCLWETPVPYPDDGKYYIWDEPLENWKETDAPETYVLRALTHPHYFVVKNF